jgi:hypothetical protein
MIRQVVKTEKVTFRQARRAYRNSRTEAVVHTPVKNKNKAFFLPLPLACWGKHLFLPTTQTEAKRKLGREGTQGR